MTPSVSSVDSDESNDDDCKKWKTSPVIPADFVLTYNQMESELELNYIQEVHEVKRLILDGTNIIKGNNSEGSGSATDIVKDFMPTNLIFDMMTFMNTYLIRNNQAQINLEEVWGFFRFVFGLCFYGCSVANAQDKWQCYPLILAAVERLQGSTTRSKIKRLNTLLCNFEGDKIESTVNNHEESCLFALCII